MGLRENLDELDALVDQAKRERAEMLALLKRWRTLGLLRGDFKGTLPRLTKTITNDTEALLKRLGELEDSE